MTLQFTCMIYSREHNMGMGHTQGTFYFLTIPAECHELPIRLDRKEKIIFNNAIASEEIE